MEDVEAYREQAQDSQKVVEHSAKILISSFHRQQRAVSPGKGLQGTQNWGGYLSQPNSPPAFLLLGSHTRLSLFPLNLGVRASVPLPLMIEEQYAGIQGQLFLWL